MLVDLCTVINACLEFLANLGLPSLLLLGVGFVAVCELNGCDFQVRKNDSE